MTDEKDKESNSLMDPKNLGKFAKGAGALAKKVYSVIGGTPDPSLIREVAQAKADASIIAAEAQIQVTNIHRRAAHRWLDEEVRNQNNMDNVVKIAAQHVAEDAKPENMENDWITNFFNKARYTSDEDMQQIWARILAGEANNPGSYSKRAVNILAELDKRDVELFQTMCRFGWYINGKFTLVIFSYQDAIYTIHGIDFDTLLDLESLGLIQHAMGTGTNYLKAGLPEYIMANYFGRDLQLKTDETIENSIKIGIVLLTKAGSDLAQLTNLTPIEGFYEYTKKQWEKFGRIPPDETK